MWRLTLLVIVLTFQPLLASQKLVGTVIHSAALQQVQSYCVETRNAPDDRTIVSSDAYVIEHFLQAEDKPQGALRDLPWKRVADCTSGNPDAIVTTSFLVEQPIAGATQTEAALGITSSDQVRLKTTLLVFDAASKKVIYRLQTNRYETLPPGEGTFLTAIPLYGPKGLHNAFKTLGDDVRRIAGTK